MQTNHTPGPWTVVGAGVYTGSPQNDNIVHIATAHFYGVPGDPMANAALIAAAPDMLAMLAKLTRAVERLPAASPLDGLAEDARAIIARATGEA